jgi:hypothetical protein
MLLNNGRVSSLRSRIFQIKRDDNQKGPRKRPANKSLKIFSELNAAFMPQFPAHVESLLHVAIGFLSLLHDAR